MTCFHIVIVVSEHFIVMTKDYINCESTYSIIFDGVRGLTATVNDVSNVMLMDK